MFDKFKSHFINIILNNPKKCLLLGSLIFLIFLSGIYKFKSSFTPRIWFAKDSKFIKNVDEFEKTFGSDQFIALGIYHPKGALSAEGVKLTRDLSKSLWQLPDVIRVESLATYNYIQNSNDEIFINPLMGEDVSLDEIIRRVDETKDLNDFFISEDRLVSVIQLQLRPYFDQTADYGPLLDELDNVTKGLDIDGVKFLKLGSAAVTHAFKKIATNDNKKMLPVLFAIILFALFLFFKTINGLLVPMIISLASIGATLGLMGHFDYTFNSILGAIPGVILAICLADSVHLLNTFSIRMKLNNSRMEALKFALDKNFLATILTSITTAISFATISWTDLVPIHDLGVLCALGCFIAWLFTYLFLPTLILIFPETFNKPLFQSNIGELNFSNFPKLIARYRGIIIGTFTLITVAAIWLSTFIEVNSDPLKYFSNETEIVKDLNFLKKHINGTRSVDFVVDSGTIDGTKNPDFLKSVDDFIKELTKDPQIIQINSILDPIKRVHQQIENTKELSLPKTQEQVSGVLMLYQMGLPASLGIENLMSVDNRLIRLKIKWSIETTKETVKKEKEIYEIGKKYNLSMKTGGYFPIYISMNEKVVDTFFTSMISAMFFVFIIMLLVFRDFKISLIAMLPNIVPLLIGSAVMAAFNIYIDIGTAIVCSICLGIAVDDTIHFIVDYLKYKKNTGDGYQAIELVFQGTGKALFITTILLVFGFGSFVFADFLPNRYFGILCAVILLFALITDLVMLPAILMSKKEARAAIKA